MINVCMGCGNEWEQDITCPKCGSPDCCLHDTKWEQLKEWLQKEITIGKKINMESGIGLRIAFILEKMEEIENDD